MDRVVVTGGLGFVGSHLVDRLVQDEYEVVVIDDLSSGLIKNIERHASNNRVMVIKGDIRDKEMLKHALTGAKAVVHLAAIVSVIRSIEEPELVHDVNVAGTLSLLDESVRQKVRRFIYASSAAVYGRTSRPPLSEEFETRPISPYGASKAAGESYCHAYHAAHDIESTVLRFMNIYGPRSTGGLYSGVMVAFAEALNQDKSLTIYGDGEQTRDFVFVSDVVDAIILALEKSGATGETFNIGSGIQTNINQLAKLFMSLTPYEQQLQYASPRKGEIRHSYANIGKARRILGYEPKIELSTGVKEFFDWYHHWKS